jgi:hypothetical protein
MKIEELNKLVELELQWLKYYAYVDSRNSLNENSNLYEDLISIGYTKRVVKLDRRCVPCIITSDEIITENFDVSNLRKDSNLRGYNRYSPVEAYIKIFPKKKMEILNKLKTQSEN